MIPLLGILVVFGAVIGGFAMESGHLAILLKPAELVIIGGAAFGTMLAANPLALLRRTCVGIGQIFREHDYDRESYLATLLMLYSLFDFARKHGMTMLEEAVDDPGRNAVFRRHAALVNDPEILAFLCDTLRMTTLGVSPAAAEAMLTDDIDIRRCELEASTESLVTLADSLPGLGIVAAVLGVILTMGSLTGKPETIGQKVATALIGTFLGILLSYGLVAPVASKMEKLNYEKVQYYETLQAGLIAYMKGMPAAICVECARRCIPVEMRPDFNLLDKERRKDEKFRHINH